MAQLDSTPPSAGHIPPGRHSTAQLSTYVARSCNRTAQLFRDNSAPTVLTYIAPAVMLRETERERARQIAVCVARSLRAKCQLKVDVSAQIGGFEIQRIENSPT